MRHGLETGNIVEADFCIAADVALRAEDYEIAHEGATDCGVAGVVHVGSFDPDAARDGFFRDSTYRTGSWN